MSSRDSFVKSKMGEGDLKELTRLLEKKKNGIKLSPEEVSAMVELGSQYINLSRIPLSKESSEYIINDSDRLKNLSRSEREKVLEEVVKNQYDKEKSVGPFKIGGNFGFKGLSARNVIENTIGGLALKEIPNWEKMDEKQLTEALMERTYKGLREVRDSLGVSTDIKANPELYKKGLKGRLVVRDESNPSTVEGIELEPFGKSKDRHVDAGTALHELRHLLDYTLMHKQQRERDYAETVSRKTPSAKFSKLQKALDIKNPKLYTPRDINDLSLEEYQNAIGPIIDKTERALQEMENNYPNKKIQKYSENKRALEQDRTGELVEDDSNAPLKDWKDVSEKHFLRPEKPYDEKSHEHRGLDNFHNILDGGLKDVVENQDKFKNIIKKLA
jgi:hypothetical protein